MHEVRPTKDGGKYSESPPDMLDIHFVTICL